jgi:hypothetical protein
MMTATRRRFLAAAGACGLAAATGLHAEAADDDAKVVLLGTRGGPRVNKGPSNPANLVVAGGRSYVWSIAAMASPVSSSMPASKPMKSAPS